MHSNSYKLIFATPDTYTRDLGGFNLGIIKEKVSYLIRLFLVKQLLHCDKKYLHKLFEKIRENG